ncbi:MAG TPA: DUF1501 domain-containing protein [Gemmataceae bacterium]|nr:DUF1501 domain-containing protein [Gemmataceae bacterium]
MFGAMNRRHFLKHLAGMSALALPGLSFLQGLRAAAPTLKKESKSLIIFWMGGGPSHLDLWDLKPGEPTGGEFKPIRTSADGVQISELLPTIAKEMKNLAIVRSLNSNEADHNRGTIKMNTGRTPSPVVQYPHVGSVLSSQLTPKDLPLPGFIGIGGTAQRIGPGFLGSLFAPFTVQNAGQPPANIKPPDSLGQRVELDERLRRRQRLFYTVEESFNYHLFPDLDPGLGQSDEQRQKLEQERLAVGDAGASHQLMYKKAFDLTVSPLKTIFEVRNEPAKVKEAYGGERNGFGMGCLLARKLVEKGVTCVEIDLGGWDNHGNIFNTLRNGNGPRLDKGMGSLVRELDERGLLKNTVVLWMGDFGRTPRINQGGGRDHWARGWSVVIGGGAIKGGQVYGATSKDGLDIKEGQCSVGDVFATVFKGLGLDPATQVRDNLGRPINIADGKPLKGLV